nr:hypothetical protein [Planctomycetota bacterium]
YMSPEQARGATATAASDIYALGATLYQLILLRPPLVADAAAEFWRRKAAGDIDLPTADERRRVPRHLLAIALKAMAAEPGQRYADVAAMAEDLARFQGGQAISACSDTIGERARRALRDHGRRFGIGLLAGAVILTLVALLWGERLARLATWGAPIMVERFDDGSWGERWQVTRGSFERRDGQLVTTSATDAVLLYPHRLLGPTAIEYDGTILAGSHPCDLSLYWIRDDADPVSGKPTGWNGLLAQVGAFEASYSAIVENGSAFILAEHPFRPVVGRTYRIRVEIVDDTISLSVDGELLCRYRDQLPLVGGWFAFYGYYPGKAFDNVQVYSLGLPQRMPATAVGDAFAQRGMYATAADEYARVAASHRNEAMAEEAVYRQGLCQWRAGERAVAMESWRAVTDERLSGKVALHRVEQRFDGGDHRGALDDLAAVLSGADQELRAHAVGQWMHMVRRLLVDAWGNRGLLQHCLDLRDRQFSDIRVADRACAKILSALDRDAELIERFPSQRTLVAQSLRKLDRCEEVLRDYSEQRFICAGALDDMGRRAELDRDYPEFAEHYAGRRKLDEERFLDFVLPSGTWWPEGEVALVYAGRLEEALALPQRQEALRPLILPFLGRAADLDPKVDDYAMTLMAQGRYEELLPYIATLQRFDPGPLLGDHAAWPLSLLGLEAWIAGDRDAGDRRFAEAARCVSPPYRQMIDAAVVVPFLHELDARAGELSRACDEVIAKHRWTYRQRPWHRAMWLAGRIDDAAFLAQTCRMFAGSELLLLKAIRAELAGRSQEALAAWREFIARPPWQRAARLPSFEERLARWRVEELAGKGPTTR